MSLPPRFFTRLARQRDDEKGTITLLALFMVIITLMTSAFAIDFSYLQASRTQLQVAADRAAHAALYYRERNSANDAKLKAIEMASYDMPDERYGYVLRPENIEFGSWDYNTQTFTPDATSLEAVRVRTARRSDNGNSVTAYLFAVLDARDWDITTEAVFVTFQPPCLREGFVADGIVDIQSNNGFSNGFCVHSNTYVSLNSNNYFEGGTIVSMPDLNELDLPKSGFETNEGLQVALRRGYYRLRVLGQIEDIEADLLAGYGEHVPDYITSSIHETVSDKKFNNDNLVENRINILECTGAKGTIEMNTHLKNMVLFTDCELQFGQGVILEDVLVFNQATGAKSINSPSGFQIGVNDDCADGGGSQIVTRGGVDVASDLQIYGGQIIALGDIEFAANANGIQGASLISAQEISGTSNMDMGFCGSGMEDNFAADYFRLAL
ncbi:pilus assembly protein TadG-related protein [Pseudooceanicola sp. LIPI14-2-Ac024]|uniref:pilus assembly protein TadG-related protein n=1 Tax=Pseudooceanicola sp. LIPI14-2-Ac024 TaxID=3344875 RepID=UPI0035CFA377